MTNNELKAAIEYSYQCSKNAELGYNSNQHEAGKLMLEHLKELLSEQLLRAKKEVTQGEVSDEIDRLRQVCRDTYEVWAGSDATPTHPMTASEAYLIRLLEQMRNEIAKGL
jgi:hypothetical protein